MNAEVKFSRLVPGADLQETGEVKRLLACSGLGFEEDIHVFVVGWVGARAIACAGLTDGVVKCVAIDADYRGSSLALKLMSELVHLAWERGHNHLFLYTKAENLVLFQGCGFHEIVEIPGCAWLMENTPVGVKDYCNHLRTMRVAGDRIGSIVVNANPFTLGHLHLIRRAVQDCDWLHIFVVSEDASAIAYEDRLDLVRAGVSGLPRLTVHEGSRYMISKGTFPNYFIKNKGAAESCSTATDLLLFRQYIAPALGITHRFVGSEPFCPVTRGYNSDMRRWLEAESGKGPMIRVVEYPRFEVDGVPVSASAVRRLLARGDFDAMASLVPATTLALMGAKYGPSSAAPALEISNRVTADSIVSGVRSM